MGVLVKVRPISVSVRLFRFQSFDSFFYVVTRKSPAAQVGKWRNARLGVLLFSLHPQPLTSTSAPQFNLNLNLGRGCVFVLIVFSLRLGCLDADCKHRNHKSGSR